jgi:hypothetical protein
MEMKENFLKDILTLQPNLKSLRVVTYASAHKIPQGEIDAVMERGKKLETFYCG